MIVVVVLGGSVSLFPRGSAATVEEQRARLPAPTECPDKVEGTWAALYFATNLQWLEYTAVIRRTTPVSDGNAAGPITVDMTAHLWDGPKNDPRTPACKPGQREVTVTMPGTGKVDAGTALTFRATTYTVAKLHCGNDTRYYPDNFKGTIEPARQEFQAINNDGNTAVNEPVVFRRVRCLNAAAAAPSSGPNRAGTAAKPPSFEPPKRLWSCGR